MDLMGHGYYAGSRANAYAVPVPSSSARITVPNPYVTNRAPTQITPQTTLRPGMVLPDGAVVVSVGPADPNAAAAPPAEAPQPPTDGEISQPDEELPPADILPPESSPTDEPPPIPTPDVE